MARAKRRVGRPRSADPLNQKVTARFSDEEFAQLEKLGRDRQEKLSSVVRNVVRDTLDEVRKTLKKRGRR
jgi:hypothetical protein